MEPFEDLPQAPQARPRPRVGDGGGAKGPEVAQDRLVGGTIRVAGTTEPRRGRGQGYRTAVASDPSRRHVHQWQKATDCVRQRRGVPLRPPRPE